MNPRSEKSKTRIPKPQNMKVGRRADTGQFVVHHEVTPQGTTVVRTAIGSGQQPSQTQASHPRITVNGRLVKVGGSTMAAVPPAVLDAAKLKAGAHIVFRVFDDKIVIQAAPKVGRLGLAARLARCADGPFEVDREFLDAKRAGCEEN